ncbi:putative F-box protein At3g24700 [Silene latifolia]|uniref:putative F-box protein At3g24700 n=1 Tax=Silene latifolia TaxID=37657 RepID=UPI003D77FA83
MKKAAINLPPELLFEVLSCVPAKDLSKLRVVCKLWNSIICDPSFHQYHLDQLRKKNINGYKYYLSSNGRGYFSSVIISSPKTLAFIDEINLPNSHYDRALNSIMSFAQIKNSIMARVDGVLLVRTTISHLGKYYANMIFLWNPTLGKVVDIPLSEPLMNKINNRSYRYWDIVFGFGFDSVSNIYKVVALYLEMNDLKTAVYNLSSRSWTPFERGLIIDDVKNFLHSTPHSLNFEGCVYWLATLKIKGNNETHYLSFNLSTEALTCSKLPDAKCDEDNQYVSRYLSVLYESLALVDCYHYCGDDLRGHIRVWIRRKDSTTSSEFSWVELYNLNCDNKYFINLANNGSLYLRSSSVRRSPLSVYDLKTGKEEACSNTSESIYPIDGYLGSLALLT